MCDGVNGIDEMGEHTAAKEMIDEPGVGHMRSSVLMSKFAMRPVDTDIYEMFVGRFE